MLHARPAVRSVATYRPNIYQLRWLSPRRHLLTLAIETSCDDTAVAILETTPSASTGETVSDDSNTSIGLHSGSVSTDGQIPRTPRARLLFNEKITARNTGLGGIHPLEALESHQVSLSKLIGKATAFFPNVEPEASSVIEPGPTSMRTIRYGDGSVKQLPDFISVTRGPGMRSNLNCGLDTAKGLAAAWQVPLLGVHHMQAHALTPRLVAALDEGTRTKSSEQTTKTADFPFLTLLVSGGHTMLLHSNSLVDHKILATTRDVAIGDALDKCGRVILPDSLKSQARDTAFARYLSDYAFPTPDDHNAYPVPKYRRDEIAKPVNQFGWQVQAPLVATKEMAFSFTGIATSVERLFHQRTEQAGGSLSEEERILFARTALGIAFEHLASRTIIALEALREQKQEVTTLVVSGGVAANAFLRHFLRQMLDLRGFDYVRLLFPPPWLCTDNAAMIAWCGLEMFEAGYRSPLDINTLRKWSMDPAAPDGGILGVGGWTSV